MGNGGLLSIFTAREKDVLYLHLIFTMVCVLVLMAPIGMPPGVRMLVLVILYNLALPLAGLLRHYDDWVELWLFSFVLSLFQIFPDWFLSAQLDILVFPEDGLFKIGTVSGYMGGLWTIPIFLIVYTGMAVQRRLSEKHAYGAVACVSLLIFGGSEQTLWLLSSWYAKNVTMIGHTAIYILVPEILLGLAAFYCFEKIRGKSHWLKIPFAFLVMQFYLGSAAFFYFLIEKVLLNAP